MLTGYVMSFNSRFMINTTPFIVADLASRHGHPDPARGFSPRM